MSQPLDPWTQLRHQAEQTERLLRRRETRRSSRITVRNRAAGPRD
ncbi:hypothetical protein ABIB25_001874 [Nakamurella sp. UYEF19]